MLDLDKLDYCGASEREKKLAIALDKYLKEHPERKEGIYSDEPDLKFPGLSHGHLSVNKFCKLAEDAGADVSWINFKKTTYGVDETIRQLFG